MDGADGSGRDVLNDVLFMGKPSQRVWGEWTDLNSEFATLSDRRQEAPGPSWPRGLAYSGSMAGPRHAQSMPSSRSASSWSWVSLSLLDLVFDTHTPSFTVTGSVSPSTAIGSVWPRGTGRPVPSRSTHCVRAASPRWNACCALYGPFLARAAAGSSAALIPSAVSRHHLDVPADYTDPYGYTLGTFITTMRDARTAGRLDADWIAELDTLGMIWDKHAAAWRARLTAAADYYRAHGHLAAPATTPTGAWLAEHRSLASRGELDGTRAASLEAIDSDWQLPHGPDWHRKYHLLRSHLADGNDPAALDRSTVPGSVKIGSWLHRQLTEWNSLAPRQQQLLTDIGTTPQSHPLTAGRRTRRTFAQTVQILELFMHREQRAPTAREEITVDGDRVKIGPWLAKARTQHRAGQLPQAHADLVASLFDGDWSAESTPPSVLA